MPLQDHFSPPLSLRRKWHAFHHSWATVLAFALNRQLPSGYFAEPNVQFGIEIDVAAFSDNGAGPTPTHWIPPEPTQTLPLTLITDIVEVAVFSSEAGPVLAGAIELVSPANKDRPASRDAFVSKCASYLQQAVGLIIVDVVTSRQAELHPNLVQRVTSELASDHAELWAAAYRPTRDGADPELGIWHVPLATGQPLPTLPLWLKNGPCLKVDLEATYEQTSRELGIS